MSGVLVCFKMLGMRKHYHGLNDLLMSVVYVYTLQITYDECPFEISLHQSAIIPAGINGGDKTLSDPEDGEVVSVQELRDDIAIGGKVFTLYPFTYPLDGGLIIVQALVLLYDSGCCCGCCIGGWCCGIDEPSDVRLPNGFLEYESRIPPLVELDNGLPYNSRNAKLAHATSSNSTKH